MNHLVDVRGKQCPIPVVETKKVLATISSDDTITVWVDNEIAVQNLCKMAQQKQLSATTSTLGANHYQVALALNEQALSQAPANAPAALAACPTGCGKTVVVLSSNTMGSGDDTLGAALMKAFVYALTEQDILPDVVLLYNGGAHLSVEGAPTLQDLKLLEEQGVEILTCGTCLNHYGIADKLGVGSVTNMYTIAEHLMQASKVIRP